MADTPRSSERIAASLLLSSFNSFGIFGVLADIRNIPMAQ
jgi:hypothetical protein